MPHKDPVLRALCQGRPSWEQVALIAGRQERAITVRQLRDCGLSAKAIETATGKQHLCPVHRGVRIVGPGALSTTGKQWAAHLAAGRDTAVGGGSAGLAYGFYAYEGPLHLVAPTERRNHHDVTVHHLARLDRSMIILRGGLPVLRPAHVLLDLATDLGPDELAIALHQALARKLVTPREVERALERRPGHHGLGRLAAALSDAGDDRGRGQTASKLEEIVLLKLRAVPGLPRFLRNEPVVLAGGRVAVADILFREHHLMVELDSRTWHEQRRAMDSDRRRDQQALAVGIGTFRITWRQANQEWEIVLADLLDTLETRRR